MPIFFSYQKLLFISHYRYIKEEWRIFPPLVYLAYIGFAVFNVYFLLDKPFARYVYFGVGLTVLAKKSPIRFIALFIGNTRAFQMLEKCLLILPFSLMLLYLEQYVLASLLPIVAILSSFISLSNAYALISIFPKYHWEFISNIRHFVSVLLLLFIAYIASMGFIHDNKNLVLVATFVPFLMLVFFSSRRLNHPFYIWIYGSTPQFFLWDKLRSALRSMLYVSLLYILLIIYFPDGWYIVIIFILLGMVWRILHSLLEYTLFPTYIGFDFLFILYSILLLYAVVAPWLLIILLALLYRNYRRASKNLAPLLH